MLELGGPLGSTNTSCLILQTINVMLIEYVTVPATVPSNLCALSHFVLTTNRHFDHLYFVIEEVEAQRGAVTPLKSSHQIKVWGVNLELDSFGPGFL